MLVTRIVLSDNRCALRGGVPLSELFGIHLKGGDFRRVGKLPIGSAADWTKWYTRLSVGPFAQYVISRPSARPLFAPVRLRMNASLTLH